MITRQQVLEAAGSSEALLKILVVTAKYKIKGANLDFDDLRQICFEAIPDLTDERCSIIIQGFKEYLAREDRPVVTAGFLDGTRH